MIVCASPALVCTDLRTGIQAYNASVGVAVPGFVAFNLTVLALSVAQLTPRIILGADAAIASTLAGLGLPLVSSDDVLTVEVRRPAGCFVVVWGVLVDVGFACPTFSQIKDTSTPPSLRRELYAASVPRGLSHVRFLSTAPSFLISMRLILRAVTGYSASQAAGIINTNHDALTAAMQAYLRSSFPLVSSTTVVFAEARVVAALPPIIAAGPATFSGARAADAAPAPTVLIGLIIGIVACIIVALLVLALCIVRMTGSCCGVEACWVPLATCCGVWPLRGRIGQTRNLFSSSDPSALKPGTPGMMPRHAVSAGSVINPLVTSLPQRSGLVSGSSLPPPPPLPPPRFPVLVAKSALPLEYTSETTDAAHLRGPGDNSFSRGIVGVSV